MSTQRTLDQEVMEGLCVVSVLVFSELDLLWEQQKAMQCDTHSGLLHNLAMCFSGSQPVESEQMHYD